MLRSTLPQKGDDHAQFDIPTGTSWRRIDRCGHPRAAAGGLCAGDDMLADRDDRDLRRRVQFLLRDEVQVRREAVVQCGGERVLRGQSIARSERNGTELLGGGAVFVHVAHGAHRIGIGDGAAIGHLEGVVRDIGALNLEQ